MGNVAAASVVASCSSEACSCGSSAAAWERTCAHVCASLRSAAISVTVRRRPTTVSERVRKLRCTLQPCSVSWPSGSVLACNACNAYNACNACNCYMR